MLILDCNGLIAIMIVIFILTQYNSDALATAARCLPPPLASVVCPLWSVCMCGCAFTEGRLGVLGASPHRIAGVIAMVRQRLGDHDTINCLR